MENESGIILGLFFGALLFDDKNKREWGITTLLNR